MVLVLQDGSVIFSVARLPSGELKGFVYEDMMVQMQ